MRSARPSEVYRLPQATDPAPTPPPTPPPPQRRFPIWIGVAGLLGVVLAASGLVRGGGAAPGQAPLVDIVSEDHAIAALDLYGVQATTIAQLRERSDIYAPPGPPDAERVARDGTAQTQRALDAARAIGDADPLASGYWNAGSHSNLIIELEQVRAEAEVIALLTATHDTLYSGTGSIPLPQAYKHISAALAGQQWTPALTTWGRALLDQMEERDRVSEAVAARENAGQLWSARVQNLQPAATSELLDYVNGLPGATVEGLRGHPIAGPALQRLEREQRLVSKR